MEVDILSRIQFALTAGFHFLFPPISIGFAVFLVLVEFFWLRTGNEKYLKASKFFAKLFAMIFAVGVVTGLIMVFQFGTNWPVYSKFVGDVFGSPLAIEAVFAFFMESTFLAIVLFGWNKISKKAHFFATIMVCIGSHLSAVWIIAANSFMQTPDGYRLVIEQSDNNRKTEWVEVPQGTVPTSEQVSKMKAEITDFTAMALNKSTIDRLSHTISASWLSGAFLALGICSYYVLRRRKEVEFAIPCGKIALGFAMFSAVVMLFTGHQSAAKLVDTQPEKLAALEGHFSTEANAPLYVFGWVDVENKKVNGLKIPSLFNILTHGDFSTEIKGLNDLPSNDFIRKAENKNLTPVEIAEVRPKYWAPVQFCFQTFRIMVYIGGAICLLILLGGYLWIKRDLFNVNSKLSNLFMKCAMWSVLLPLVASQVGWAVAEVGRQPWIVWHILRTSDAVSTVVSGGEVLFSIILFTILFVGVSGVFCWLFFKKIKIGVKF